MPQIIITGASGFIGSYLCKYFSEKKWKVLALQRNIPEKNFPNISYRKYDLSKPLNSDDFQEGSTIIHCAVSHHTVLNATADINYNGTKNLIDLCRQKNCKIIFLSSLSAHKEALSEYGKSKLSIEELFNPQQDLVLKLGFILGNGGLSGKIINNIKKYIFIPVIQKGIQPIQTAYIGDVAKVIHQGIVEKKVGCYSIAYPHAYNLRTLYQKMASHLDKKRYLLNIPYKVAFAGLYLLEILKLGQFSTENLKGLKQLKVFPTQEDLNKYGCQLLSLDQSLEKIFNSR